MTVVARRDTKMFPFLFAKSTAASVPAGDRSCPPNDAIHVVVTGGALGRCSRTSSGSRRSAPRAAASINVSLGVTSRVRPASLCCRRLAIFRVREPRVPRPRLLFPLAPIPFLALARHAKGWVHCPGHPSPPYARPWIAPSHQACKESCLVLSPYFVQMSRHRYIAFASALQRRLGCRVFGPGPLGLGPYT